MDLISALGLAVGILALLAGQALEGGHIGSLVQLTAFVIVVGGTFGAVLLQSPARTFVNGVRMVRWIFKPPAAGEAQRIIALMVEWSHISRKEGLLALEMQSERIEDDFQRKGIQLLVDGVEPDQLREAMEVEIGCYETDLKQSAKVWEAAGGYSPTIGILGAVMGLIHVMENLSDPSKLGAGIAVAFVATIYGVGLANLVLLPISRKLLTNISRLVLLREMYLDGLIGIANGDNPRIIEARLQGYLASRN